MLFTPMLLLSVLLTKVLASVFYPEAFSNKSILLTLGVVPSLASAKVFIITLIVVHIIGFISLTWYVNQVWHIEISVGADKIIKKTAQSQQAFLIEDIQEYAFNGKVVCLVRLHEGVRQELVIPKNLLQGNQELQQWIKDNFKGVTRK